MFSKAIEDAQKTPDGAAGAMPKDPFDLFAAQQPPQVPETLVDTSPAPGTIPGSPRIQLEYFAQRFFMGRELVSIDENQKVYEYVDETPALKEIMQLCLDGKAMILKRIESVSATGSVIVWMEWGVYKAPTPAAERDYMTLAELKSPHAHTGDFEKRSQRKAEGLPPDEKLPEDSEAVSVFAPEGGEGFEPESEFEDRSVDEEEEAWGTPDPEAAPETPDPDAEVVPEED